MHFRDSGPREKTAALFIHGMLVDGSIFEPVLPAVGDRRCILVDLPGHGASADEPVVPFDQLYETIEAELPRRGVEQVTIVGQSLGAYLAFGLAVRGKLHIDGLALFGALAGFDSVVGDAYRSLAAGLGSRTVDLVSIGLSTFFAPASFDRDPTLKARALAVLRDANLATAVSELGLLADHCPDLRGSLERLTLRVLLRVGALDQSTPVAWVEELARHLPNARLEVVPGAGHALPMEDLEGTRASLKRFLG